MAYETTTTTVTHAYINNYLYLYMFDREANKTKKKRERDRKFDETLKLLLPPFRKNVLHLMKSKFKRLENILRLEIHLPKLPVYLERSKPKR